MKKIFILLFTIMVSAGTIYASVKIGDLCYDLDEKDLTAEVTYETKMYAEDNYLGLTNVNIPSVINYQGKSYQVTSIGYAAFAVCQNLTSVTIPNSVTTIGVDGFRACENLVKVLYETNIYRHPYQCGKHHKRSVLCLQEYKPCI